MEKFDIVTPEELLLVSSQIACHLDPLPAKLLLKSLHVWNPVVLDIVNTSLQTGFVPPSLKEAILKPALKNFKLNYCEYMNFRRISNLAAFLSKVVEKEVSKQIIQYIDFNKLNERYQSAYRAFHSTETALLKVHNDIAWSIDAGKSVILVTLDLSAALTLLITTYSFRDCQLVMGSLVCFWSSSSHIFQIAYNL